MVKMILKTKHPYLFEDESILIIEDETLLRRVECGNLNLKVAKEKNERTPDRSFLF